MVWLRCRSEGLSRISLNQMMPSYFVVVGVFLFVSLVGSMFIKH